MPEERVIRRLAEILAIEFRTEINLCKIIRDRLDGEWCPSRPGYIR